MPALEKIKLTEIKETWKVAVEKVKKGEVRITLPVIKMLFECGEVLNIISIEKLKRVIKDTDWMRDNTDHSILSKLLVYSDIMDYESVPASLKNMISMTDGEPLPQIMYNNNNNATDNSLSEESRIYNLLILIYSITVLLCEQTQHVNKVETIIQGCIK